MNIKSASGFPTPNTVCVREQARCAHFVQTPTRSRTAADKSALFRAACSCRSVGDVPASRREAATGAACNCASAVLDARGARSFFSRIFSSAAMTRSRAGCVMYGDHPKFRTGLQTISVKEFPASWIAAELEIRQPKTAATADLSGRQDHLEHAAVLPTGRLIQQFQFGVQCRFDVHLRARIGSCGD